MDCHSGVDNSLQIEEKWNSSYGLELARTADAPIPLAGTQRRRRGALSRSSWNFNYKVVDHTVNSEIGAEAVTANRDRVGELTVATSQSVPQWPRELHHAPFSRPRRCAWPFVGPASTHQSCYGTIVVSTTFWTASPAFDVSGLAVQALSGPAPPRGGIAVSRATSPRDRKTQTLQDGLERREARCPWLPENVAADTPKARSRPARGYPQPAEPVRPSASES